MPGWARLELVFVVCPLQLDVLLLSPLAGVRQSCHAMDQQPLVCTRQSSAPGKAWHCSSEVSGTTCSQGILQGSCSLASQMLQGLVGCHTRFSS